MPSRDCKIQGKLSNPSLECHRQLHWHRRSRWKSLILCLSGATQLRPRLLLIFATLRWSGSTTSSRPVQTLMIAPKMLRFGSTPHAHHYHHYINICCHPIRVKNGFGFSNVFEVLSLVWKAPQDGWFQHGGFQKTPENAPSQMHPSPGASIPR